MHYVASLLLLILLACSVTSEPQKQAFIFPPEWEPHQAVWISINDQWMSPEIAATQIKARLEMVKAMHAHVPVNILTISDSLAGVLKDSLHHMAVDTTRITTIIYPTTTYFLRDPGPIFLSNGSELHMANWQGIDSTSRTATNIIERKTVDDSLAVRYGYTVQNSPLCFEGGGIDVSTHAAMAIKDYAFDHNGSQYSVEEIEQGILELYGKQQMIWLEGSPLIEKKGLKVDNYWGYAPGGHIDAVARFVNDSTILVTTIAEEDKDKNPIARHDYEVFQGYIQQLQQYRTPEGKPYQVVPIPSPDLRHHVEAIPMLYWSPETLEFYEMEHLPEQYDTILVVPAINYANFLVTNGVVLVPQYWKEGLPLTEKAKDETMVQLLQQYFPDREIIGLPAREVNMFGGGIHCATQQEPKVPAMAAQ